MEQYYNAVVRTWWLAWAHVVLLQLSVGVCFDPIQAFIAESVLKKEEMHVEAVAV